jgi:cob(I)alamin adenosyltransferase
MSEMQGFRSKPNHRFFANHRHERAHMPRITKVYTRTGDEGMTGLGSGARVSKTSARIGAFGVIDELNATIGVVLANEPRKDTAETLARIQNELFHVGADLCIPEQDKQRFPGPRIEARHVTALETDMDRLSENLPPLENFILPGGSAAAAYLHLARTTCRRAERDIVHLAHEEAINVSIPPYLNRLSDLLFVLARYENQAAGYDDVVWDSRL